MYVFCSSSVTLRNISVHMSKNIWKKVGILVFELSLSQSISHINFIIIETLKMFSILEFTWKRPGILLSGACAGRVPGVPEPPFSW